MNREDILFPKADAALRDDVRWLGALVGDMLREQSGESLFQHVESVRLAAIARREGDNNAASQLRELTSGLPAFESRELTRAFSGYFQVVNLAERVHRVRRLRNRANRSSTATDTLAGCFASLNSQDIGLDRVQEALRTAVVEPVFTAHPTEATRRTLILKWQRVMRYLLQLDAMQLAPVAERRVREKIFTEISTAWQTEEYPAARLTVASERDHVMFYLLNVLYGVLPEFHEQVNDALQSGYGERLESEKILEFGSWVGGDMDGNPYVSPATLEDSLEDQKRQLLRRYRSDLQSLYKLLSQSESRVGVSEDLRTLLRNYAAEYPVVAESISPRHKNMPYRRLLRLMGTKLSATLRGDGSRYRSADEFVADLNTILRSLVANHGQSAGAKEVRRLISRVHAFGFHLAAIDVRQHADVFQRAAGQMLGEPGWLQRDPATRLERLRQAMVLGEKPPLDPDSDSTEVLEVFRSIAACQERFGRHAVRHLIVSMTAGADDIFAVMLLAGWAGLADQAGNLPLDLVPLFETLKDLHGSMQVMHELYRDDMYTKHLDARGRRQLVMLGYSDSGKDAGLAASRWSLYRAQQQLGEQAREHRVLLHFFHGRGGTVSRGGGKSARAILAAPAGSVNNYFRATEQGEIIDARYGTDEIAMRSLEQVFTATLQMGLGKQAAGPDSKWEEVMQELAKAAATAWRELVYENSAFLEFFRMVTPIDVIERLRIGSRPAARGTGGGIHDLRSIPWVFAWTQNRCLLPGWYGLGTALEKARKKFGDELLREMISAWPFFSTLLADVEMVLAKSELEITEHYLVLVDPELSGVFERIKAEHQQLMQHIFQLKQTDQLLQDDPTLARAIVLRNPYVDPMNMLQVDLLKRWRDDRRDNEELLHALFSTVKGIAHGMQNTG